MAIIVNGERIEDEVIQRETMQMQQGGMAPDAAETAERNVIARVVMRQEAIRRAYAVTPAEIEQGLHKLFMEQGGKEAFMQRHRLTEAEEPMLREHVVSSRRIEKLVEETCADVAKPDADAVRAYFDEHGDEFVVPERVRASHVVKRPTGPDDDETFVAMCEVRKRLQEGANFAELAEEYSDCHSEPGGDLGFFAKGQMVPGFETVAFSMAIGEISPVFVTQFGMHVMQVFEREAARPLPFDEVKDDLAKRLHDEAKDQAFNQYLDQLIARAEIRRTDEAKQDKKPGKKKGKKKGGK